MLYLEPFPAFPRILDRTVSSDHICFTAAHSNGQAILFYPCGLFFFLLSFCLFPRLFPAVADSISTILPHMVWP